MEEQDQYMHFMKAMYKYKQMSGIDISDYENFDAFMDAIVTDTDSKSLKLIYNSTEYVQDKERIKNELEKRGELL